MRWIDGDADEADNVLYCTVHVSAYARGRGARQGSRAEQSGSTCGSERLSSSCEGHKVRVQPEAEQRLRDEHEHEHK